MEIIGFMVIVIIALALTFVFGFCVFAQGFICTGSSSAADYVALVFLAVVTGAAWWLAITESPFKIVAQ